MNSQENITIFINGTKYQTQNGQSIMQAADHLGYSIPRLCYHPQLSVEGACRICIVEIEGMKEFQASCSYPIQDGMRIHTNTTELRQARRDILELILDNHPLDCHTCPKNGNCELQRLANILGIEERHFEGERKQYPIDDSSPAIIRNPNNCILCGRCVRVCSETQQIHAIGYAHRGFKTVVMPSYNQAFDKSVCINCGQCINICPTAAFTEKKQTDEVIRILNNKDNITIAQIAPSVRIAIGESFGIESGHNFQQELTAALKALGFDYVFDTQFGADMTIMEEAAELAERYFKGENLPLITSCCPSWVKTAEQFHPDLLPHLSSCRSPMAMLASLTKGYLAKKNHWDLTKVVNIAITPCTAKKFESSREELFLEKDIRCIDYALTTREISWIIKSSGIDLSRMKGQDFDNPMGISSGAASIVGTSGGVIEATLRTFCEKYLDSALPPLQYHESRTTKGIKEATIVINDKKINIAVANGLKSTHSLMDEIRRQKKHYDFVEIMACPGGCIGGGGQPYAASLNFFDQEKILQKRSQALYAIDSSINIHKSHENPAVQQLYKEFLGTPLSELANKLLHTQYSQKIPCGIIPKEVIYDINHSK
ncbi:MAG: iron hydrogenase small subunit [Spirochaetales bacterium]|nr:iron hydrogenase small subunit [Spirochaetales bacterium]